MKILVINGPNLNFLGIRDTAVYGSTNYDGLVNMIGEYAASKNIEVECFQSNHEGAIIDRIQDAYGDGTNGIVINPGAYAHYSLAIRDALDSYHSFPKIEVHISDIKAREDFRHESVTAPVCDDMISGHGLDGYLEGIDLCLKKLENG